MKKNKIGLLAINSTYRVSHHVLARFFHTWFLKIHLSLLSVQNNEHSTGFSVSTFLFYQRHTSENAMHPSANLFYISHRKSL